MLSLLPRENQDELAHGSGTTTSKAAQACMTCRKQKRRCDKTLPSCSRCASLQRLCDYSESGPGAVPTAGDFAALQKKLKELEGRLNSRSEDIPSMTFSEPEANIGGSEPDLGVHAITPTWNNRFPSVFFLDSDVYKAANTLPPKPEVTIPMVSYRELYRWHDSSEG